MAGESHRPPRSERCRRPFVLRRRHNSSPCTWYSLSYFDRVRFSAGATLLHAFEVEAGPIRRVTNTADDERGTAGPRRHDLSRTIGSCVIPPPRGRLRNALNCRIECAGVCGPVGTAATMSWISTACGGSPGAGTTAGWNAATPAASRRRREYLRAAGPSGEFWSLD